MRKRKRMIPAVFAAVLWFLAGVFAATGVLAQKVLLDESGEEVLWIREEWEENEEKPQSWLEQEAYEAELFAGLNAENGPEEDTAPETEENPDENQDPDAAEARSKGYYLLYSEPDEASEVTGDVLKDEVVYAIDKRSDWFQVIGPGGFGFMKAEGLVFIDALEEAEEDARCLVVIDSGAETGTDPDMPLEDEERFEEEQRLVRNVAVELAGELVDRGYEVILLPAGYPEHMSVLDRVEKAGNSGADLCVCLRVAYEDATGDGGYKILCQTANNPASGYLFEDASYLAESLWRGLRLSTQIVSRGIKQNDSFPETSLCSVPTAIVELGVYSNERDYGLLQTEDYWKRLAYGIADGIDLYAEE